MVQRTDPQAKRAALEAWLGDRLPAAESVSVSPLVKAAGGYGSEIHFFDLTWREAGRERTEKLLVREEPMVFRVFPEFHLAREFTTMKSLEKSDIPVPRMFWLETDAEVLGAPFYIMGKGEGDVLDLGYGMLDALRWTGETSCSVRIGEAWSILIERDPETTARTEVVVVMPAAHPGLKSVRRTMRRAEQEVARSTPHEPAPREDD